MERTYHAYLPIPEYPGLHCTVLPWFRSEAGPKTVENELNRLFRGTRPVPLLGHGRALFGRSRNVPVTTIYPSTELMLLHMHACDIVRIRLQGHFVDTDYAGHDYKPHVADHDEHGLPAGTETTANRIVLAEIFAHIGKKRPVHTWTLRLR